MLLNGWRKVVFADNRLTLLTTYVKTRTITELDDLIPKVLPYDLSCMLMMYLTTILPAAIALTKYRYPNPVQAYNVRQVMRYHLCHQHGKRTTAETFRETMPTVMQEYTSYYFTVSLWRHFITCVGRLITSGFTDADMRLIDRAMQDQDEETIQAYEENVMNMHSGHSTRTSNNNYAIRWDLIPTSNSAVFEAFLALSRKFHRFWGLDDPHESVIVVEEKGGGQGGLSEEHVVKIAEVRIMSFLSSVSESSHCFLSEIAECSRDHDG